MRGRCIDLIAVAFLLVSCSGQNPEVIEAIRSLDAVIKEKQSIEDAKNQRIAQLKSRLDSQYGQEELYNVMNDIFNEYFQYDVDSAIFYAHRKLDLAMETGRKDLILDAKFDIADRYVTSGMNQEALEIVSEIDTVQLGKDLHKRRNSLLNTVYSNLIDRSNDPFLVKEMEVKRDMHRQRMIEALDSTDIATAFVGANLLVGQNKVDKALELLLSWEKKDNISLIDKGILCYSIGCAYRSTGERDKAKIYLAKSAAYDLMVPKYEYLSLIELAGMLYEDGDIKRAYAYIMRSVNDANRANAQNCKENVYLLMPIISGAYDAFITSSNLKMKYYLFIMGMMLVAVVFLIIVVSNSKKKVDLADRLTRESNQQLKVLNEELRKSNMLLRESNRIKDSYLGHYLNMCSDYIDSLNRYRTSIRKIAKEEGEPALLAALKSKEFIDKELKGFYAQFDETFLELFPDFIPQLNELLQEDKQVKTSAMEKKLTTELRILALIRIGVNDSVRIAHFLRRSVSTIYNYRVKMKNSAKGDREEFEKSLLNIGKRA